MLHVSQTRSVQIIDTFSMETKHQVGLFGCCISTTARLHSMECQASFLPCFQELQ